MSHRFRAARTVHRISYEAATALALTWLFTQAPFLGEISAGLSILSCLVGLYLIASEPKPFPARCETTA
jgi:hypothetical protein